jgi:polygalacturonase
VHPVYCDGVSITDVTIRNPSTVVNTDGIDPDSSSNVYIARCSVVCGGAS